MLQEVLSDYAQAIKRVFPNRSETVGASEIGHCARKVFYVKHSGEHIGDAEAWGARTRGSVFESAFWEPALRARHGANLLYAGSDQHTLRSGYLSATPDGLIINQPRDVRCVPYSIRRECRAAHLSAPCGRARLANHHVSAELFPSLIRDSAFDDTLNYRLSA